MYSYIKGQVTEVKATNITIEASSIGYAVKVPNPYAYTTGEILTIYIYQYVREDLFELYGFKTYEEQTLFKKFLSVKGLGPKGALAILASSTYNEIANAINEVDAKFFAKFPGIGQKLSQQIVLDLKGKVDLVSTFKTDKRLEQVELALKSLGYSTNEIRNVVKNIKLDNDTSISDLIKIALKGLKM